jgi:cell division protein ZapA (FtsZ GTPase activity inhibitor)
MEKSNLQIKVLGTSFSIAADEDSAYMENLLDKYKAILENTRAITGIEEPLKLAIVSGFLLCDEIEKMKQEENRERQEAEQRTLSMIAHIDKIIPSG